MIKASLWSDNSPAPRVAYLLHSLKLGGVERQVITLAENVAHKGFTPLILCFCEVPSHADSLNTTQIPIVCLSKPWNANGIWWSRKIAKELVRWNVSIVQSQAWSTLVEAVLACRLAGIASHVHVEHGTVLGYRDVGGFKLLLRRLLGCAALRQVAKICAVSFAVATRTQRLCFYPLHRIEIIPNGVPQVTIDASQRRAIRNLLGIANEQILIGSVGRLNHVKGFDLLLQAVANLRKARFDIACLLVGSGPELERLKSLASRLELSSIVHFCGLQRDPTPWYSAMDVYVNSSRSEGLSMALLEAMSCRLPIVATNVGDHGRILESRRCMAGVIVQSESVDALTEGLKAVCGSADLRLKLGTTAQQLFQREFTVEAMVGKYVALYRRLLERRTDLNLIGSTFCGNLPTTSAR